MRAMGGWGDGGVGRPGRLEDAGKPNVRGPEALVARYWRMAVSPSPHLPIAVSLCAVALLVVGCRATPGEAPSGRERLTAEPRVRVGLVVDSAAVALSAAGGLRIAGPAGEDVARSAAAGWTIAAGSDGRLSGSGGGRSFGPVAGPLTLSPAQGADPAAPLRVNGRPYRGTVLVRSDRPGRVTAVNVLELEEYLKGVVPFEIGRLTPGELEAVKSQAVAARTYAIGRMGKGPAGFDFYATVQDQVYGGLGGEDSVATRAVKQTRGEIVTYRGQPIMAYYSSTCGGQTAASPESWPWRPPQPYLQSVSDRIPGSDRAYCDISPRYRWTTRWTLEQLRRVLRTPLAALDRRPPASVRQVEAVRILGRTPSGRVDSVHIRADGRDYTVRADSIRWVLRMSSGAGLNSSMLFDATLHPEGDSIALEVHGGGYGHGIGMCQYGAIGRARAGQSYRQILGAYYQGTRITRLY